jgi:IS30 family transposase
MKSYTRLTLNEREKISQGLWRGETFRRIAERIGRPECTVGREVWKNVKYKLRSYHGVKAHTKACERSIRGRPKKFEVNIRLREHVEEKLRLEWSPEEIAERLKLEYPNDMSMRVSHETIYQYLYCLPRGELKKELMKGLRHERKGRRPRINTYARRQRIQDIVSISERPKETENRTVPGHWEGDLILGKGRKSALGTLVERTTRLTLLVPLTKKDALSVKEEFEKAFLRIPAKMKKSLTYDRGTEMSQHKLFTKDTGIQVYFADPYSPWQRGTNENTNGLIRQYFPKGTDFSLVPLTALKEAERRLNERPRKTLEFYTPSERFYELITKKKLALGN